MKLFVLATAALLAGMAHAQVFKCPGPDGKTIYSDKPCAGAQVMDPNVLKSNALPAGPKLPSVQPRVVAPEVQRTAPSQPAPTALSCPSERDVRNMETSASSTTMEASRRTALQREARIARACLQGPEALAAERSRVAAEESNDEWKRRMNRCSVVPGGHMFCY